ncbi:BadF/BadG/BcrA/BcrD ATPase family protein [Duganella qianjiadongensis]|uniref:ATPase n=1 Tax=Duganella qianjiadongensis TaxID=2692176 RepID=A0ABW9VRP3_9BURK|nr:BadF/BadG/BcrA/BcrD ATPase family protein [Duganella qianjiadongensis]MYM41467.1 ATPase [Duganella qianjiadongensis]
MRAYGLGIDAGGTQTRWALAAADGQIVAEGAVAGLSVNQMQSEAGRSAVQGLLQQLAAQVLAYAGTYGRPQGVCAGLTGFDGVAAQPAQWLAMALQLPQTAIQVRSDIEIAYLDSFAPGEGYLVYAGTGSIAAWIDAQGTLHRAGGRGVLLDDGGGGYWIAREALRHIWRQEDEAPDSWRQSALAQAVFERIGGSDWALSRQFVYGQERGALGELALAVAASADADPAAQAILRGAGLELARIGLALVRRYGARPMVLGGRAATLHPLIAASMRAALPAGQVLLQKATQAHHAAARIALHCQN